MKPVSSSIGQHVYDITGMTPEIVLAHLYQRAKPNAHYQHATRYQPLQFLEAEAYLKNTHGMTDYIYNRKVGAHFFSGKQFVDLDPSLEPEGQYVNLGTYVTYHGKATAQAALEAVANGEPLAQRIDDDLEARLKREQEETDRQIEDSIRREFINLAQQRRAPADEEPRYGERPRNRNC